MRTTRQAALLAAIALLLGAPALAADEDAAPGKQDTEGKVIAVKTMRASQLNGMEVRNHTGDQIGTVNELVIDLEDGKISYVALSHGGVLGIGDKLFAVPWKEFKFKHGRDDQFFVLDMEPEKLKAAPGFDSDNWPDFADPNFTDKIDKYYEEHRLDVKRTARTPATRN